MSGFALLECQKAIYSRLTGDSTLNAIISGVYDRVPDNTAYPYVTIGNAQWRDWSTQSRQGSEIHLDVHAYSRKGGRKEALDIMARVYALLHDGSLSVTGHHLVMMRCESAQVRQMEDGLSYAGEMNVRLLLIAA